jgi:hypothetical protein
MYELILLLLQLGLLDFGWQGLLPVVVSVVVEELVKAPLTPDGHLVLALVAHLDQFARISLYLSSILSPLS